MTVRRLQSGRELVTDAVERQAPTQQVKMGVLIAPYSGGEFAHVQLTDPNRSASGIVRARVLHGVIVDTLPAGTPCTLTVNRGQVQVLGFGGAAVSALAATAPPDPVDPPSATVLWEKFMDTVGFEWSALPEGWSTFFASPNTGTSEYLEFTAAPLDTWHYAVTGPYATMLLNAVTVMETKFYIPAGETTQIGLVVLGSFYTGSLVYIDSASGTVYINDEIEHGFNTFDGVPFSYLPADITTGVWYTFRVMRAGYVFTAYIDGNILGTIAISPPGSSIFEELTGTIDGVNDTFSTSAVWESPFPSSSESVQVYINGLLQNPFTDYTVSYLTREIIFTTPPLVGDVLFAAYNTRLGGVDSGMPLVIPGVWAREGTARFKDIVGWRLALP